MEAPHNTKRRRRNPIQQIVWNARGDKGACPENSVDVVKFSNCKVFRKGELVWEDVWVQDGIVIDPMKRFWEASDNTEFACDVVIDCQGQILAPGFIDLQLNGAFGVDITNSEVTEQDIDAMAHKLLRHGCTAFVPTMVTSSPQVYAHVIPKLYPRCYWPHGSTDHDRKFPQMSYLSVNDTNVRAMVLGAHLEGPFISEEKKGAHDARYVRSDLSEKHLEEVFGDLLEFPLVRIVTLAPELPGALQAANELSKKKIVVSMGHSVCDVETAEKCFFSGATMITHLFNAMRGFHHRDPGIIGMLGMSDGFASSEGVDRSGKCSKHPRLASQMPAWGSTRSKDQASILPLYRRTTSLESAVEGPSGDGHKVLESGEALSSTRNRNISRPYFGLIADGIHCHPYSAVIAHHIHPAGLFLVTDGIAALGLGPGTHQLGSMTVEIEENIVKKDSSQNSIRRNKAVIQGTTTLAGAVCSIDSCLANFYAFTGCTLSQALRTVTETPAKALGLYDYIGDLSVGKRADMVLLSKSLEVNATYIAGRRVFNKNE